MKIEITSTIKEIGQIEEFGANGFQKRNLVLSEPRGEYEDLFCVEFSGEKVTAPEAYQIGQKVTVSAFVNCREWSGKYFTSLSGTSIVSEQVAQPQQPAFGTQQQAQAQAPQYQQPPQNVAPQQFAQPATQQVQPQQFAQPQPANMAPPALDQNGNQTPF